MPARESDRLIFAKIEDRFVQFDVPRRSRLSPRFYLRNEAGKEQGPMTFDECRHCFPDHIQDGYWEVIERG